MTERFVNVGRISLVQYIAYHWAVQVGNTWYEITTENRQKIGKNAVQVKKGEKAASGASTYMSMIGKTLYTDEEIDEWIKWWLKENPKYHLFEENCQKFALDFVNYLTDGKHIFDKRHDAAIHISRDDSLNVFTGEHNGNKVIAVQKGRYHLGAGNIQGRINGPTFQLQKVGRNGFGAFNTSNLGKMELAYGNVVGAHLEPNLNTGFGKRNGNYEAHLLGFGGKVGEDGVEVNTPLGGVSACSLM